MLTAAAVERLAARAALAAPTGDAAYGYGPIQPAPDQHGRMVLALPAGFSYVTFGEIGSPMSDGNPTPLALDGIAAFPGPGGTVRLIRNHEDRNPPGSGSVGGDPAAKYDASVGGGTTTLDYNPVSRSLVRDFISLNGTTVNCAGGFGPGRLSWLTGEETIGGPEHADPAKQFDEPHGVSTSGGDAKNGDVNTDTYREGYGQVWEFRPRARSGGLLILHYESPGGEALDSPDNMTVTPGGGLLLAEDDASDSNGEDVNRLVGIARAASRSCSRATCSATPSWPASASAPTARPRS